MILIALRFDYDLTKTFDILVGKEPNQQRFTVYHDIITRRSKFFHAARSGRWTTQPDQATVLDDHEPDVFSVYLHCVNFGRKALHEHIDAIPVTERIDNEDANNHSFEEAEEGEEGTQDDAEDHGVEGSQASELESDGSEESNDTGRCLWKVGDMEYPDKFLVDLYLLADKLMDPATANMAIDKLISVCEVRDSYPSPALISYVYGSTTVGSPLRRLIRDWYVLTVSNSWVDGISQRDYPHDFLKDLVYEIHILQRDNPMKRVRKVFAAEKLADRRTKDHYHQKVDKISLSIAMPQHHHQED